MTYWRLGAVILLGIVLVFIVANLIIGVNSA